ncbi:hypothetical protein [Kitasatospora albolonga]|uniref:hypothetical protein n=1 Tax=Kitasatospora albolonga TaxID=68173 RepID=UPI0035E95BF2
MLSGAVLSGAVLSGVVLSGVVNGSATGGQPLSLTLHRVVQRGLVRRALHVHGDLVLDVADGGEADHLPGPRLLLGLEHDAAAVGVAVDAEALALAHRHAVGELLRHLPRLEAQQADVDLLAAVGRPVATGRRVVLVAVGGEHLAHLLGVGELRGHLLGGQLHAVRRAVGLGAPGHRQQEVPQVAAVGRPVHRAVQGRRGRGLRRGRRAGRRRRGRTRAGAGARRRGRARARRGRGRGDRLPLRLPDRHRDGGTGRGHRDQPGHRQADPERPRHPTAAARRPH